MYSFRQLDHAFSPRLPRRFERTSSRPASGSLLTMMGACRGRIRCCCTAALTVSAVVQWVRAEEPQRSCADIAEERVSEAAAPAAKPTVRLTKTPLVRPLTADFVGSAMVGRGLRLNNPFRLATPLGETPESVSLTASYLDLSLGGAAGRASGPAHGAVVHLSIALQGIAQQTITPSYQQLWRVHTRWLLLGRLGFPVVTRPDVNAGIEGAVGAMWFATAGTGITGELVGSMFYGAATRERDPTGIPIIGFQVGVFLDYEVIQ